jgi:hypothetical protein
MSIPTEQPAPAAQTQGTHHFIFTVQKPGPRGVDVNTFHGTLTPAPSMTRADIYQQLRAEHERRHPHMADANVLFFALEPNQL